MVLANLNHIGFWPTLYMIQATQHSQTLNFQDRRECELHKVAAAHVCAFISFQSSSAV